MNITEYIEVSHDGSQQLDRYKLVGINSEIFLQLFYSDGGIKSKTITEEEYENHPNRPHYVEFDVEGKFISSHYIAVHESIELEKEWNDMIKDIKFKTPN